LVWQQNGDTYQLNKTEDLGIGQTVIVMPQSKWVWKGEMPEQESIQELIIIP
jgi:hypothetical protein